MRFKKRFKRYLHGLRVSPRVRLTIWVPALIFLIGYLLWGTPAAEVRGIRVEGAVALNATEVSSLVKDGISAPLIGPWISSNVVIFPRQTLEASLKAAYPRISEVEVTRDFRTRVVNVALTERVTFAIYCAGHEATVEVEDELVDLIAEGTFPPLETDACFLMDRSGVAFANAPETEGSLIMTLIDAQSGEVFHGNQVIERELFEEIILTWETFTQGIKVKPRRVLKRPEDVITIETFEGWEAVLSNKHPLNAQVVALRELLAKDLEPDERALVEIIDLRVPGRIYYR